MTVGGEAIPDFITGEDADSWQQFFDLVEPLMPGGKVYGVGAELGDIAGARTMIGIWTLADGREVPLSITYANEHQDWKQPLTVTSAEGISYPANPVPTQRPEFSFVPSNYPASAYANAIAEGRAQVKGNLPPDVMNFSAMSDHEVVWQMMAGPVERVHGSFSR